MCHDACRTKRALIEWKFVTLQVLYTIYFIPMTIAPTFSLRNFKGNRGERFETRESAQCNRVADAIAKLSHRTLLPLRAVNVILKSSLFEHYFAIWQRLDVKSRKRNLSSCVPSKRVLSRNFDAFTNYTFLVVALSLRAISIVRKLKFLFLHGSFTFLPILRWTWDTFTFCKCRERVEIVNV